MEGPISFSKITGNTELIRHVSTDYVVNMVCRYIEQERGKGKTNADFPIGYQYKDDMGKMAEEIVKRSKVNCRILSNASLIYICRAEWVNAAPTAPAPKPIQQPQPQQIPRNAPVAQANPNTLSIYVLRCEGGRYYVGKSTNAVKRYEEHVNGEGSAWTRRYPPILLEKTIYNASPFDEDKVTKEYMAKYGIDKVRGGSYVTEVLDAAQIQALQREIRGATDACSRCGLQGHFVKDCRVAVAAARPAPRPAAGTCYTCGRPGHYSSNCYARTTVDGYELESDDEDEDEEYSDDEY
jgi:predicted GIY-YIG superfamily endonuclease